MDTQSRVWHLFLRRREKGRRLPETHTIDPLKVRRAFYDLIWDAQDGLYFSGIVGTAVTVQENIGMVPLTLDAKKLFCGSVVSLHGFGLQCVFDTTSLNPGFRTGMLRQPTELVLRMRRREHRILLTWPPGTPEQLITLQA